MSSSCIDPKCNFSKRFNKCIKPNPYIEMIAKCGREKIKRKDCKYTENKDDAIKNSCNNYRIRTNKIKKKSSPIVIQDIKKKSSSIIIQDIKKKSSLSPNTKKKLSDIKKNIMARKITKNFRRFILPFINRVSANINSRVYYYDKLNNILKDIDEKQCLDYINDGKSVKRYNIGSKDIILDKRIGTDSVYGIIYFSKLKLYKFASKIMKITIPNRKEVKLTNELSNITTTNLNPHFPIVYKTFKCDKPPSYNNNYPLLVNNSNYYVMLNELANGDLKTFLPLYFNNYEIIINTLQQIFISILSFHKYSNLIHNDCHWGNFLYHKIKPGGYIHYKIFNKDIYIKNIGFLWIIWDYGLTRPIEHDILIDYKRVIGAFQNEPYGGWVKRNEFIYNNVINNLVDNLKKSIKYSSSDKITGLKGIAGFSYDKIWTKRILKTDVFKNSIFKPPDIEIINLNNPYNLL